MLTEPIKFVNKLQRGKGLTVVLIHMLMTAVLIHVLTVVRMHVLIHMLTVVSVHALARRATIVHRRRAVSVGRAWVDATRGRRGAIMFAEL